MDLQTLNGLFCQNGIAGIIATVLIPLIVGFFGSPLIVWTIVLTAILFAWGASVVVCGIFIGINLLFIVTPIRRALFSSAIMKVLGPALPKISETEREALDAGVVWVESDLFSGKPDFDKILSEPYPNLTAEEKAFMAGPVEKLCEMLDTWRIWKSRDIEAHIWAHIKKEKFLGMIIPKEYGGLGFTALAHSEVIMKVASRSIAGCISIMVPNSLGPAELLIHYGTDEQKKKLLPRLAIGDEMPCFALTEPGAGSDAGSITSSGEIFKGDDGKIYIRLNWNKRWITLAAISTILGLAFRLRDPKNLLGKGEDLGITCALIPSNTPGVVLGRRHDPLGVPFYNCPTQGKDVVVPLDAIIGGIEMAGKGWLMLMECLAAGRGISLPAQATGGSKMIARATSAHCVVRQQFGVSIGKFEGIEEPLARIGGFTYALEAMRRFTLGAIDKGIKPPVITAISKYYSTEIGRKLINDGMDIMGGAGISLGNRNLLAEIYIATPIGITVEGANILTRTLMIFGQGALRAHPYAYKEVKAVENNDLAGFDDAFWSHIGHVVRNTCRSVLMSATRGRIACGGNVHPELKPYVRRLTWASASFAILADVAMGSLAGTLKFREKITGRFADILGWMYICTSVIRRFEAEGRREEDLAFAKYVLKYGLSEIQRSFDGIFDNMYGVEQRGGMNKLIFGSMHLVFKEVLGVFSRIISIGSQATDHLQHVVCNHMITDGPVRDRLTEGIYYPKDANQQLKRLDDAMKLALKAEAVEKKMAQARRKGQLPKVKGAALIEAAKEKGVITAEEFKLIREAHEARWDAIQVDDFSQQEYMST